MAVVTSINIVGDSLHVISTQTRMKETPARGPERHYEGVGGTQRFATSVKRDETVVHLILDVLDFLGSFKKKTGTL